MCGGGGSKDVGLNEVVEDEKAYSRGVGCCISKRPWLDANPSRIGWWAGRQAMELGTRLGDHLRYPDTEDEHGHEGSNATSTSTEGLDKVNAADDLFVLFLRHGKSGLA